MPVAGKFFVTPHAVRQYRDRYRRRERLTFEQAQGQLIRLCDQARYIKPAEGGAELWQGPRPMRIRFIVQPMPPRLPAVVTVLPMWRKSATVSKQ